MERGNYCGVVRDFTEGLELKYHIVTFGCQMNVRDSESLAGMLSEMGFTESPRREDADIVLFNTCCVRENAENKALGNIIWLKELKKVKKDLIICVCGCMMQETGVKERLQRQYPFIDLVFGTHNLDRFPELLHRVLSEKRPVYEVLEESGIVEGLPVKRSSAHSAFITIMYGCNNFCSYCIVPYVRGRERSREVNDILSEAEALVQDGVKEFTLLGQNVNSFGGGGAAFAELLYRLDRLGVERLRFMTSHPKDLSDELIAAYRELNSLQKHLHLPVQAGSNRVLKEMNRKYTREKYTGLVNALRAAVPNIGLTTDLIVGFPGETEAEFEETLSLVSEVRFDAAYTFIYSPRAGTAAEKLPAAIPEEVKSERIARLIDLQMQISQEVLRGQIGSIRSVLVDAPAARQEGFICGKTGRGHMVNFPGNKSLIGRVVDVSIISAGRNTLKGEIV